MVLLMNEELRKIQDSLKTDAGLPQVPDLTATTRTLKDVADELNSAIDKAAELSDIAFLLSSVTAKLNSELSKLEETEQQLLDLAIKRLEKQ